MMAVHRWLALPLLGDCRGLSWAVGLSRAGVSAVGLAEEREGPVPMGFPVSALSCLQAKPESQVTSGHAHVDAGACLGLSTQPRPGLGEVGYGRWDQAASVRDPVQPSLSSGPWGQPSL